MCANPGAPQGTQGATCSAVQGRAAVRAVCKKAAAKGEIEKMGQHDPLFFNLGHSWSTHVTGLSAPKIRHRAGKTNWPKLVLPEKAWPKYVLFCVVFESEDRRDKATDFQMHLVYCRQSIQQTVFDETSPSLDYIAFCSSHPNVWSNVQWLSSTS